MRPVRVRPARRSEAALLAEMANDLNDHVGVPGRPFTAKRVRADGFGPRAAFTPLVAELDGAVVGYAFFSPGDNTDVAGRSVWLHDLFVAPAARRRGVGAALMAAVAAATVRRRATSLERGVHASNAGARAFYRRLGSAPHPGPETASYAATKRGETRRRRSRLTRPERVM
jgi:GNAT superfamily N-acetyltransferase